MGLSQIRGSVAKQVVVFLVHSRDPKISAEDSFWFYSPFQNERGKDIGADWGSGAEGVWGSEIKRGSAFRTQAGTPVCSHRSHCVLGPLTGRKCLVPPSFLSRIWNPSTRSGTGVLLGTGVRSWWEGLVLERPDAWETEKLVWSWFCHCATLVVILVRNDPRTTNAYSFPAWQGPWRDGEVEPPAIRWRENKTQDNNSEKRRVAYGSSLSPRPVRLYKAEQGSSSCRHQGPKSTQGGRRTSVEQKCLEATDLQIPQGKMPPTLLRGQWRRWSVGRRNTWHPACVFQITIQSKIPKQAVEHFQGQKSLIWLPLSTRQSPWDFQD